MKIMVNDSSATVREVTPHLTQTPETQISVALRRRAQTLLNDRSIDPQWRPIIRYALDINDPWLAELVLRADAGESMGDIPYLSPTPETSEGDSNDERIETLSEIICRAGDGPAAALFVLMGIIEHSTQPKLFANTAKHSAFTFCGQSNLYGIVDAQIAVVEAELLANDAH
jgi:hypothetical protein